MSETQTYQAGKYAEPDANDRRRQVRYPFTVTVEAVEPRSKTKIQGRTSDLSREGCYIDSNNSFSVGSMVELRLIKEKRSFEAQAEVVYSLAGMGMAVKFKCADPKKLWILDKWIGELSGEILPESETPQVSNESCTQEEQNIDVSLVVHELLMEMMRQDVLPEAKCRALLQKLERTGSVGSNSVPARF